MNALTKAFVVVVTILAVIMVALVVPFAARVPDYAQQYKDMEAAFKTQVEKASSEAAAARNLMAAKGEEYEKALEKIETQSEQIALLEAEIKGKDGELAQAESAISRFSASMEVTSRIIENLKAENADGNAQLQKQIADLGELQSQIADLTQTLISVRADNRRLSNNYLRIQEENKALEQRLTEAVTKFDKLMKDAIALGYDPKKADDGPVVVGPPIRGSVVKIDQVSDGLTFVQINVGKRDQVKEGMEFIVYRGDDYVGKVQIASVDTAESVGRLTLGDGIQEGDAVRAGGR